jgi:hypothetical protein
MKPLEAKTGSSRLESWPVGDPMYLGTTDMEAALKELA